MFDVRRLQQSSRTAANRQALQESSPPSRIAALDVLRGLAVISVLVSHAPLSETHLPWWLTIGFNAGARIVSGVELFFVLSGFLVAGLLFSEFRDTGVVDIRRFLIRRGLKIYPSFYAFVCITAVASWATSMFPPVSTSRVGAELLFFQNYARGIWSHTWSLAVEEHFYLLLAATVGWAYARNPKNPFSNLPAIGVLVSGFCLTARLITAVVVTPFDFWIHLAPTHLRLDSLFCGVLLAYFYHFRASQFQEIVLRHGPTLGCLAGLLLTVAAMVPKSTIVGHTVLQSAQFIGHGLVLAIAVVVPAIEHVCKSVVGRLLGFVGRYSYTTYLWHMPILALAAKVFGGPYANDCATGLFSVVCIPVGWMTARAIELPVLTVRDRYFPSTRRREGGKQVFSAHSVVP